MKLTIMELFISTAALLAVLVGLLFASRQRRKTPRQLIGAARVVDGDSIVVNGIELRLEGIDAPESRQTSIDARGRPYPQGKQATRYLRTLVRSGPVHCEMHGPDRYGRTLATVFTSDGKNVNAEMVRAGQAIAYTKYSRRYVKEEQEAKRYRRGMHSGTWITPRAWRIGRRVASSPGAGRTPPGW